MRSTQRTLIDTAKAPDVQLVAVIAVVFAAMQVSWPFWIGLGLLAVAAVVQGVRAARRVSAPVHVDG
jgi:hypothetical protein